MLEWTRRARRVRQRRAVCACLQTDLFISTPLICNAANLARINRDTVGKCDTLTNYHTISRNWPKWQQKGDFPMFPWLARDQHVIQLTYDPENLVYATR